MARITGFMPVSPARAITGRRKRDATASSREAAQRRIVRMVRALAVARAIAAARPRSRLKNGRRDVFDPIFSDRERRRFCFTGVEVAYAALALAAIGTATAAYGQYQSGKAQAAAFKNNA